MRVRALESADDRRWLDSILGEVTATIVGVALVATGFFLAVSDVGPVITDGVRVFSFLGSVSASAACCCSCAASAELSAGGHRRAERNARNPEALTAWAY